MRRAKPGWIDARSLARPPFVPDRKQPSQSSARAPLRWLKVFNPNKDYRDIAALLSAGTSLEIGLGGFAKMFGKDPALPLRAIGYFDDGDLAGLPQADKAALRNARDRVTSIPDVLLQQGSLAVG